MRLVAHFQRWVPSPAITSEAAGSLLASGAVIPSRTRARQRVAVLDASTPVVTRSVATILLFAEVPRSTSTLGQNVDSHADQRRLVGVHHVGQGTNVQSVGAGAFAHLVLVQTLVDADHRYVDADVLLDLLPVH